MNFNSLSMDYSVMNKEDLSELEEVLLKDGQLQIVSYQDLQQFSQSQISQFCVLHGFYVIPTLQLIEFLHSEIDGNYDKTIEIGAGHGAISRELGIRAVDNFMQEQKGIKELYETFQQTPVPYGSHVEKIDGNEAIRKYKPSIVIGAYCTHKYNPKEHWRGGNALGFNEKLILERVDKYIHIGNKKVHSKKPILKYKYREIKEDWLFSRSQHKNENVIWIWEK